MTMVSLRASLASFLAAQVPGLAGRIHPSVLPDKPQLPALVYHVIGDEALITHDGADPLRHPRLQLDIWGARATDVEPLADEVETALLAYRGAMGDIAYTAGWRLEDASDSHEDESGLYRVILDFRGWYQPQEEVS